ncbi:MAG: exopolyphosphatase, partial [Gammaproteobacteria bacterium]|nr:exopolyphosphatase [Gammaproteobacteria bacterium]
MNNNETPVVNPIAALDLGSNSFHLVIAAVSQGEVKIRDAISEKVQLGAGIDDKKNISIEAQERALLCLERYAERLQGLPQSAVRVVGTNALRLANNSAEFLNKGSKILGHDIDIIAGREEARLIYLGVSHTLADDEGDRLVIDIGGGSTEFIIGSRFEA